MIADLLWKLRVAARRPRLAYAYALRRRRVSELTGKDGKLVNSCYQEIFQNPSLQNLTSIDRRLSRAGCAPELYVLTRLEKPTIVVETGVASGVSTTFILAAMKLNGRGKLESVSLPTELDPVLPRGKQVGWLVPDDLRLKWKLHLGNSAEVLQRVLPEVKGVDLFFHDSDHSYKHMLHEFQSVWPFLNTGGFLVADDVWDNSALADFCRRKGLKPVLLGNAAAIPRGDQMT